MEGPGVGVAHLLDFPRCHEATFEPSWSGKPCLTSMTRCAMPALYQLGPACPATCCNACEVIGHAFPLHQMSFGTLYSYACLPERQWVILAKGGAILQPYSVSAEPLHMLACDALGVEVSLSEICTMACQPTALQGCIEHKIWVTALRSYDARCKGHYVTRHKWWLRVRHQLSWVSVESWWSLAATNERAWPGSAWWSVGETGPWQHACSSLHVALRCKVGMGWHGWGNIRLLRLLPRANGMLRACCTEFGDEVTLPVEATTKDVVCMKIPDWAEMGMYCT